MDEIEKLKEQVEKLTRRLDSFNAFTTIPYDVEQAFRARLSGVAGLAVSAKGLDTEDQAVDEGGAATYAVLGDPDGFLEVIIGGTTYYLPYY